MAVSRTQKGSILSTIETHLQEGKSIAFTSNQRITVDEITKMKRDLRKENVTFMLAKKTLIRLAFKNVYAVDLDLDTLP
jgi:ribosomal protein L10